MPINWSFDPIKQIVIARVTGQVSVVEISEWRGRVLAEREGYDAVYDASEGEMDVTETDIREMARSFRRSTRKLALVGTGKNARLLALYMEIQTATQPQSGPIRLFANSGDAMRWIEGQ